MPRTNDKDIDILALTIHAKRAEESLRMAYGWTLSGSVPEHVATSVRRAWDRSRSVLEEIRIAAAQNRKIVPFPVKRLKGKN